MISDRLSTMNIMKDVIVGTGNLAKNTASKGVEKMQSLVMNGITGITKWTASSIWSVLKGTGKVALNAAMSLPILPGPRK